MKVKCSLCLTRIKKNQVFELIGPKNYRRPAHTACVDEVEAATVVPIQKEPAA